MKMGEQRKVLSLGAAEYITKPYKTEILKNKIREIMNMEKDLIHENGI